MKRLVLIVMVCIFSFVLANASAFACTRNIDGTWNYCCPGQVQKNIKAD
ncbi:MAG: hypothetical protein Q3M24_11505 [Candidatus Electrothrix aestuarii]|uniref:Uncharacterized protein n=1 Tax=Candidatus Electrothrix aestuarii TaxID=3062594 RepID=A0AAU8M1L3_9BACT|nr:hypothetical protein [Candidatus Electrothrix aestuarii]WPD24277.1 MAG: hypothetical protein SD837_06885 [Candidatus Electrothrix sp. GW3-3]